MNFNRPRENTGFLHNVGRGISAALIVNILVFFLIEFQYRVRIILPGSWSSFIRIFDLISIDNEGTMYLPPHAFGWHTSYDSKPEVKIQINGAGFRGREPLDNPTHRIAFVGDSIVFGGEVDTEKTFVSLLQENMRRDRRDPSLEVLNLGIEDSNLDNHIQRIKKFALPLHPDEIVLGLYLNDNSTSIIPRWYRDGLQGTTYWNSLALMRLRRIVSKWRLLKEVEYSGRIVWTMPFASETYIGSVEKWNSMIQLASSEWGSAWNEKTWENIGEKLTSLKKLLDEKKIPLLVVLFPVAPQIDMQPEPVNLRFPQMRAASILRKLGIPFYDLLEPLRSEGNRALFIDQCHYTEEGHAKVAELLLSFLLSNVR